MFMSLYSSLFPLWVFLLVSSQFRSPPKILYSRLHPAMPWCKFHQSLVFEVPVQQAENGSAGAAGPDARASHEAFILDFVPAVPLNPGNLARIFMGQSIPGKYRLLRLPMEPGPAPAPAPGPGPQFMVWLETRFHQEMDADRYESQMEGIGSYLTALGIEPGSILAWGNTYQLYRRNCRHFCDMVLANMTGIQQTI